MTPQRASVPEPAPGIHVAITDGVGRVEISNPARRNALSVAMMADLAEALQILDADPGIRVVVLRGAGTDTFASGVDISELAGQYADGNGRLTAEEAAARLFDRLAAVSVPVIARIHGYCLGAGVALALGADLRVADHRSIFAIPAARLGLAYPLAQTAALAQTIGPSAAGYLLYTGQPVTAQEAIRIGLVDQIAETDDVGRVVDELAATIAANAPLSVRAAKAAIRAIRTSPETGPDAGQTARQLAEQAIAHCAISADLFEGASAFLAKRPPEFTGH